MLKFFCNYFPRYHKLAGTFQNLAIAQHNSDGTCAHYGTKEIVSFDHEMVATRRDDIRLYARSTQVETSTIQEIRAQMKQLRNKIEANLKVSRQKHEADMRRLREENANIRARHVIHHPPPPPPSLLTPPHSPSFQAPIHAQTRNQENHTLLSSYSNREETPIHSKLRSLNIHNDVIHLHSFVDDIIDIPLPIT